jgi:hypothetical protein
MPGNLTERARARIACWNSVAARAIGDLGCPLEVRDVRMIVKAA